jgi:hypothetical protein
MSKLTEQLNLLGMHNDHEFAGEDQRVYIRYAPRSHVSFTGVAGWRVTVRGMAQSKVFSTYGISRLQAFEQAKAWAGKQYGITAWARTPFGSWMEKRFVEERLKELKAQLKAKERAA